MLHQRSRRLCMLLGLSALGATAAPARYGVASAMRLLNQAVELRDEDEARYYAALTQRLWTRVAEQDRGFDQAVETMLRKDQRKHHREWKEKLARGAAEQGRLERVPAPG
jgi:hypothetical protein